MKKILLAVSGFTILALAVFLFPRTSSHHIKLRAERDVMLPKDNREENEQEELEKRAYHEFVMTVDPQLGYVPTERLLIGEQRAAEIMQGLSNTAPTSISSLTWTERGPNNIGGRTRAIIFDKTDASGNTAIAGGVGGGIWRTTNFLNATPTWTQISTVNANFSISCIAQNPTTPSILYAGTGENYGNIDFIRGIGIYKSTDGGLTWALIPSTTTGGTNVNDFTYVMKILVYTNGDVYAAARSRFCNAGGLLKSTNGGTNWTRVIGTVTGACATSADLVPYDIDMSASGDLYATTFSSATALSGKIWKSPAGGTVGNAGTWTDITPSAGSWQRIELAPSATNNLKVYALFQGSANSVGGIRRTDDGGATWVNINNTTLWCDQGTSSSVDFSRNQAWYDLTIAVNPADDNTVFAGGVDIMKSTNGGTSWAQMTQWNTGCTTLPYVHADIHNIVYLPGSSLSFAVSCDGGLFYTANNGTSFVAKNNSYNVTQYYSCAIHPTTGSNFMLAGAQDNGSHKFSSPGINAVTTASGGDGGYCFIDQKNPLQQITNFTGTSLNLSSNGGTSFVFPGSFATDRFINPADFDTASSTSPGLSTAAFYYCGAAVSNFRRVTINFSTLTVISNSFTIAAATSSRSVSAVKVDPNTPNRVWLAYSGSDAGGSAAPQLYYVDAANTATPAATAITLPAAINVTGAYISSLDVEVGNANHLLMTLSNYGVQSIWESTDLGATWTSLDNNGVNLPDVPVRWGIFIPAGYTQFTNSVGGVLIGTELGVWGVDATSGTTTAWAQNSTPFGNMRVTMLKYRGSDKTVVAATYGRGLFTTQFNTVVPITVEYFNGSAQSGKHLLNWKVECTSPRAVFEIERGTDGRYFASLGNISATQDRCRMPFSYTDASPAAGMNYYRIKMTEADGKVTYTNIIALLNKKTGFELVNISPNPVSSTGYLTLASARAQKVNIVVTDALGKTAVNRKEAVIAGSNRIGLDLAYLPGGVYTLLVISEEGDKKTLRFVKE